MLRDLKAWLDLLGAVGEGCFSLELAPRPQGMLHAVEMENITKAIFESSSAGLPEALRTRLAR